MLLDWMQQVCMEYRLKRYTYHLSIYYVDKFIEKNRNIERSTLQLLGVVAIQLASKIEVN